MVIGKLKYQIEPERGTYHPAVLTSFSYGLMMGAELGSVLKGGGPIPRNGNKGKKLHV
jgi:hypothetical protein